MLDGDPIQSFPKEKSKSIHVKSLKPIVESCVNAGRMINRAMPVSTDLHCNAAKRLSFLFEIGAVHFLWNDFVYAWRRRPSKNFFFLAKESLRRASLHLSISFSFQHLVPSLARIRVKGGSSEKGTSLVLDKDKKETIGRGGSAGRGGGERFELPYFFAERNDR